MEKKSLLSKMKQRKIPWLGEIMDATYTSLPLLSIINFLSITVSLYLSSKPYLDQYVPWFNIGIFLGVFSLLVIILLYIVHLFVVPSLWAYRSTKMDDQNKRLDAIMEEIKRLKK